MSGNKDSKGDVKGDGYPKQPAYLTQQPVYPPQPQFGDPPPPYQPQPTAGQPVVVQSQQTVAYSEGHRGSAPVCSVPQPQSITGQPAQGVFDQGARFSSNSQVNVPPPPPGVTPTAAQVAAAQGQSVVMSQQKKDSFGFGSDGGAAFF